MKINFFRLNRLSMLTIAASVTLIFTSCDKDDNKPNNGPDIMFYGLTESGQINQYNANNPGMAESTISISGLQSGERILSIDFRPATGQLYGLGSTSRLYTINSSSGAATTLGMAAFAPALGSQVANIDFNPTVDRIRLVTNNGQNLRLHPELGTVAAEDGAINGGSSPSIISIAYTNSRAGAESTTLYDIDLTSKKLYKQDLPNNGTLVEVGTIDVDFTARGGFDISPDNNVALAAFTVGGATQLYTIDLNNANTRSVGMINETLIDLAIPTDPVAYAVDENKNLQIFNPAGNAAPISKGITGLASGDNIVGIDFRPATGELYALGSTSKLYTFNLATGALTMIPSSFTLDGTFFGFDFNPTVDRIRVVSNMGQNIRLHPVTGAVAGTDGNLNPGTPNITAAAYTNNFPGATTTTLYVMDATTFKLYKQDPPNNGTLVETGNLGVNIETGNGFDIGGNTGEAWAVLTAGGSSRLYSVNLTSGMATAKRDFPNKVRAFAVGLGF